MKFTKRTRPADFGAPQQEGLAETPAPAPWDEGQDSPHEDAYILHPEPYASPASPPWQSPVAAARAHVPVRREEDESAPQETPDKAPSGWPIYLAAFVVAVLWAAGPIAFAIGYRSAIVPFRNDLFALGVFALLAVGPAVFVFFAAYLIQQGRKLGAEARRAKAMAEDMLSPALVAAARARDVAFGVREEIARAGHAADEARETLLALREALAQESERLLESADQSRRSAHELTETLGRERSEMGALSHSLDAQANRVTDSIGLQAKMVAEATELAQTQLREAEAALSARAADLAAAAGEASDAARTAGEDLTRHIARLETAGAGVAEQVKAVESGLGEQRTALITLAQTLKTDHQGFAEQAEAHAAKLGEFIDQARASSGELTERALKGGESLRALMADAASQFRDLAETAKAEREEFGQSTLQSLETVSEMAAEQRAQLEAQTRAAIEALAAAAEATRAAAASHAAAARASLAALQEMMAEVDRKAAQLPKTAEGQVELVRAAVTEGLEELSENARRTAEEAQAIDAAFQERARRNFEMLSEAVRLMGASASLPHSPLPQPAAAPPAARAPRAAKAAKTAAAPPPVASSEEDELEQALEELMEPPASPAADPGLRPRLKLTPTASDAEFAAVFEAAGGVAADGGELPNEGEAWTWKDLLASIDGADAEGERLQDVLAAEVAQMGVDPVKLLPKARIDEIAAAVQTGDLDGAREVVKRLAPAAIRRISRRLVTDDGVRRQVQVYVRRYQTLVDDAAVRDPEGFLMASLLGDEAGRLYLLLDAAAGDPA